ncbi:MAG: hypothetical protein EXR75_08120 [Myxococcales bacterium]|nr:hypothetical protein [Myxococcales bacterium]
MSRVAIALFVWLLFVWLGATPAFAAKPSIWTQAANPDAARDASKLRAAMAGHERFLRASDAHAPETLSLLVGVRALAENARIGNSNDPVARYLAARLERASFDLDHDARRLARAKEHLRFVAVTGESLQAVAPTSERSARELRSLALYDLAVCHAHTGARKDEIAAYDEALALEVHPLRRSVHLANRAEALMAEGRLQEAVRGYRTSLAELPAVAMGAAGVTTLWGLAIALDRSGDLDGGLESVKLARSYDPGDNALKDDGWFFVPAYDEHYYAALGQWQAARVETSPAARIEALRRAEERLRAFIDAAPTSERWLPLAEHRLRQCERERSLVKNDATTR